MHRAGKRRRPATAYDASSAAVAKASGAHIASGMYGSKVMCVIKLRTRVGAIIY